MKFGGMFVLFMCFLRWLGNLEWYCSNRNALEFIRARFQKSTRSMRVTSRCSFIFLLTTTFASSPLRASFTLIQTVNLRCRRSKASNSTLWRYKYLLTIIKNDSVIIYLWAVTLKISKFKTVKWINKHRTIKSVEV